MSKQKPVPPYDRQYYPYYTPYRPRDSSDFDRLNRKQAGFFRRWKNALRRREGIDIAGQADYIRKYVCESVRDMPPENALAEIALIRELYGEPTDTALAQEIAEIYVSHRFYESALELREIGDSDNDYVTRLVADSYISHGFYKSAIELLEASNREDHYIIHRIADCFILLGCHREAHKTLERRIKLAAGTYGPIDSIWSLKLISGDNINGQELLALLGPQLTGLGKASIETISECLDVLIETYERENNVRLLDIWSAFAHSYQKPIKTRIDSYTEIRSTEVSITEYSFGRCETVISFVKQITRLAENIVREEVGLPRVGEGWPSETRLYLQIRNALPDFDVQQHYSPYWLDRQHLDIYIHELGVALEYQGKQHDEPVEFFGGQQAFELNKERDARKKRLCEMYGVHIVYVRPGYQLADVLCEIKASAAFEIEFESAAQSAAPVSSISAYKSELLQIDGMTEVKPVEKKYLFDPEFQVERIEFDLNHKVSRYKVRKYEALSNEIHAAYRPRNNPSGIDEVIELCKKHVALSFDYAQHKYQESVERSKRCIERAKTYDNDPEMRQRELQTAERVMNYGYWQIGYEVLVKILERQRKYTEALKYALKAKSECWYETPAWDKIIFRLSNRVVRNCSKQSARLDIE